jgi:nucleotide-binding universal stress UspA family protein
LSGGVFIDPSWDDEALAAARGYLARMAGSLKGLEVTHEATVAASVPAAITTIAAEQSVELIVMSTHALTGAARALLGSVTGAVVRTADCPVLVIHRAQPRADAADERSDSAHGQGATAKAPS